MYNSHKKKVELKNQLTVHSSTTHKGTKVQHQIPPNENQCHKNSDSVLAVCKIKHKKGKKIAESTIYLLWPNGTPHVNIRHQNSLFILKTWQAKVLFDYICLCMLDLTKYSLGHFY